MYQSLLSNSNSYNTKKRINQSEREEWHCFFFKCNKKISWLLYHHLQFFLALTHLHHQWHRQDCHFHKLLKKLANFSETDCRSLICPMILGLHHNHHPLQRLNEPHIVLTPTPYQKEDFSYTKCIIIFQKGHQLIVIMEPTQVYLFFICPWHTTDV